MQLINASVRVALKSSVEEYSNIEEDELNRIDKEFFNELELLREAKYHQNVNCILGITKVCRSYILVLEYANEGTLRDYLKKKSTSSKWKDKTQMALDIACGLKFLHFKEIIHRDLHSKNILVNNGKLLIADLGLSKKLAEATTSSLANTMGMVEYIEPQCLKNIKYKKDKKSDIYSLGVLLWEISSGRPPFSDCERSLLRDHIEDGNREEPTKGTPLKYQQLYQECWNSEPNSRPDIEKVYETLIQLKIEGFSSLPSSQSNIYEIKNSNIDYNDDLNISDYLNSRNSRKENNELNEIKRKEEENFHLKDIIKVEVDWKFLNDHCKLDYGRTMSYDGIKIAEKQAYTMNECELIKINIYGSYEKSRIEFTSIEDWMKKTNLFFSVDEINVTNFAKLGLSVENLRNKSFNKEVMSTYQCTKISKALLKFSKENLKLTDEFKKDVNEAINSENPRERFKKITKEYDDLRKRTYQSIGKRILYTSIEECYYCLYEPGMYQAFELNNFPRNILEEVDYDIFASVFENNENSKSDFFNCQILKKPNTKPSIIIHGIQMQKEFKPCEYKLKIKIIIIGYDTDFNFMLPDISVESMRYVYNPKNSYIFYNLPLQRKIDLIGVPLFGIPVLSNLDLSNSSIIIGHNFCNTQENGLNVDVYSYCLEKKCYDKLPQFTFCVLIISDYPSSFNSYSSLPFNSRFSGIGTNPYV
ncbi:kinase-like protein [Rhizophagus irregularis]|uniref:Kinase-like protein n=1 Tax=Rhizophagus irregularis TaxID=588596 RepID=A0A2I1HQG3_9GLOM|nr:kinase-like protein [Rhizophagus irregularis]